MLEVRQKDIRNHYGKDITNMHYCDIEELRKAENGFETIAMSYGVYGMNGGLYRGRRTGDYYKVTQRAMALWQLA